MAPGGSEETTGGCTRIWAGFLAQRTAKGTKKRWVVFQGDTETGIFQLKVFKDPNEKILKIAYTVSKGTFVGIERGELQEPKRGQRAGQPASYLALLLVTDTLVFHESMPDLVKWHSAIKKYFESHSWDVVPTTGVSLPESQVVLHITQHAMSLATANPPKHYQQWDLGRLVEYGVWGARVYFHIDSSESRKGYLEMRASTPDQANSIRDTISRLLPHLGTGKERKVSLSQIVPAKSSPSPTSPQLRNMNQPDAVISGKLEKRDERNLVFNFPSSSPPPTSSRSPSDSTPPPVTPRPPSTLLSPQSPDSPPRSGSPLMLNHPPVKLASPSGPRSPARRTSQPNK